MERLDKLLCSQGTLTRSEAGRLVRGGRVTVGGVVCRQPSQKVDPTQTVTVDGKPLNYQKHVYIMLNKPAGILCVSRDPKAQTVVDLLPAESRRKGLFPAGRLDKDTHGLALITDDGDFAHEMLSPRHHIPKTYHAVLDKLPDAAAIKAFCDGPTLDDGTKCLPAELTVLGDEADARVEVIIYEGKFHQIKRMFSAIGCHVEWLKRMAMGGLLLDESLEEGASRPLTEEERLSILHKKEDKFG